MSGSDGAAGPKKAPPAFGVREPDVTYRVRPSAYGILPDGRGRIAAIETPGGWFLPGGGRHEGETPEACLHREILEELGLRVAIEKPLGEAAQFFHAATEAAHFHSRARFYLCRSLGTAGTAGEDGHRLRWIDPEVTETGFVHEYHAWAVDRYRRDRTQRRQP